MDLYGSIWIDMVPPPIWQVYEPIEADIGHDRTTQADMMQDTMESLAAEEAKRIESISHSCGTMQCKTSAKARATLMLAELDSDMLERRKEVRELNKEAKKEALQAKRALKKSSKQEGKSRTMPGDPKHQQHSGTVSAPSEEEVKEKKQAWHQTSEPEPQEWWDSMADCHAAVSAAYGYGHELKKGCPPSGWGGVASDVGPKHFEDVKGNEWHTATVKTGARKGKAGLFLKKNQETFCLDAAVCPDMIQYA